jgi:glutaredoxin
MKGWDMVTFTLEGCEHCKILKEGLQTLGIPFNDVNVSLNSKAGDIIENTYKCYSYPIIILKQPAQMTWLPETELLPSPSIRVYFSIYGLIDEIFNKFNK